MLSVRRFFAFMRLLMRLLTRLYLLLLLRVFLLHLSRLLLMPLFHLLLLSVTCLTLLHLLMLLILLLLELLPLLILLGIHFLLLLLILPVKVRISCIRRTCMRRRRKVLGVNRSRTMPTSIFWSRRRIVMTTFFRRNCAAFVEGRGLWCGSHRRLPMILRSSQRRIGACGFKMLRLRRYRRNVFLMCGPFFIGSRPRIDTPVAAVIADTRAAVVVNDRCVVDVVNLSGIDIVDGTVVIEVSSIPAAAFISVAEVTVAVVNATIKADLRSPVALVKDVSTTAPCPIAGSPEITRFWSHDPRTGHPVIVRSIPGPIAGSPYVAVARTKRLFIDGQLRRSEVDGDLDLRKRSARDHQHRHEHQQATN